MNYAKTLVDIVSNSTQGVVIYCPNVNELCRDILDQTGVMLRPERQVDFFDSEKLDWYGEPYVNKRINNRKFKLTYKPKKNGIIRIKRYYLQNW